MSDPGVPRIVVTCGEPAGIGPELIAALAQQDLAIRLAATGDPVLFTSAAQTLGLQLEILKIHDFNDVIEHEPGRLHVYPVPLAVPVTPGVLEPANGGYVLHCLDLAIDACLSGAADAMTTAPLHKAALGTPQRNFTGHTEYLAAKTGAAAAPVMLLVSGPLRVALVTTHLPLADVPQAVDRAKVLQTIMTVAHALQTWFGVHHPRIAVCGLNPHAGESGHFGSEEITAIQPAIEAARDRGIDVSDPLPADTAFVPENREHYDCFISMFHDQGLPVIKALGFGATVNTTLGLPIIRTSVDHGTALDIAGLGRADPSSLFAAVDLAARLSA